MAFWCYLNVEKENSIFLESLVQEISIPFNLKFELYTSLEVLVQQHLGATLRGQFIFWSKPPGFFFRKFLTYLFA